MMFIFKIELIKVCEFDVGIFKNYVFKFYKIVVINMVNIMVKFVFELVFIINLIGSNVIIL